jgi:hypothetical protein
MAQRLVLGGRIVAAVLVLIGGYIHLKLYFDGYRDVPDANLGRSFLLNAAASLVVAAALVLWRNVWALVAGLLLVRSGPRSCSSPCFTWSCANPHPPANPPSGDPRPGAGG